MSFHAWAGVVVLFLTFLITLSGMMITLIQRYYQAKPWVAEKKLPRIINFHKVMGYLIILLGNVVVSGGLITYQ